MVSEGQELHIFVFPLMAAGHMLPAVDIAKLLALEGATASIITTAGNAPAVEASIRHLAESGHRIHTLLVEFSSSALSLPDNMSLVKSAETQMAFLMGTSALRPSFERLVKRHRPSAIISDMFFPWTVEIAEEFDIPRLVFHGTSFFSFCVEDKLHQGTLIPDENDRFPVPGLPHLIELSRSQLPDREKMRPDFANLFIAMKDAENKSYGAVVNSFYELEPDYAEYYRKVMGRKAWHIGPTFLRSDIAIDNALRGVEDDDNQTHVFDWLDSKAPSSVLYVCFGSLSRFTKTQLREIAAGLESSGHCFIWVVRSSGDEREWLPVGFKERAVGSGTGMIIHGRVPQLLILNKAAVGGFLTHCGWNSSLESIAAGLPVATWPMFGDQFYNERMLVDVLKVGVEIGVKTHTLNEDERELVKAEEIAAAVVRLMGDGPEAKERRRRARELKAAAKRAVEEGGSSRKELWSLIRELPLKHSAGLKEDNFMKQVPRKGLVINQNMGI